MRIEIQLKDGSYHVKENLKKIDETSARGFKFKFEDKSMLFISYDNILSYSVSVNTDERTTDNDDMLSVIRKDKSELINYLGDKYFIVTFEKKDGSTRVLKGTTNLQLIPENDRPTNIDPKTGEVKIRKDNPKMMNVYDVEVQGWRMFTIANLLELPVLS